MTASTLSGGSRGAAGMNFLRTNRLQFSITGIFLLLVALYVIGNPRAFGAFPMYQAFMSTMPFFGIIAVSMTLVVTLGEVDLSFPSVVGITSYLFGVTLVATDNFVLAVAVCLAAGTVAGLINGLLVAKVGIPSIVATLGMQFLWRGLVNMLAQGKGIAITAVDGTWHHALFVGRLFGLIPAQFVWFIGIALFVGLIYRRHRFGNHVHFVGDNEASARMMGIDADRVRIIAFVQLGFFSAFAGIFAMYELLYFWPSQGSGLLLTTLAAVFVGGTSVFGGKGTIYGTVIGVLIIGSIESGVVAIGFSGFFVQFVYGLLITAAVTVYALLHKRRD